MKSKRYLIRFSVTLVFLMVSGSLWAQSDSTRNQLSIGLEALAHGESCGGGLPRSTDGSLVEDKSHFLLSRTRLNVNYQHSGLEVKAVIQNKAVWGMSDNQALHLYEGWVKMTAKNGLFAQVGRVELSYDDERIIGPNDFAMAAQSHDVLRMGYEGHGHQAHVILAYNQNDGSVYQNTFYKGGAQDYKSMQTLWYHYDVPKFPLGISLLFMNYGLQAGQDNPDAWDYKTNPKRTEHQQMFGGYMNYHPEYLTLELSYYRQTGKEVYTDMYSGDIRAWMIGTKATIQPTDKYGFVLGFDYLSGDDYVPVPYGGQLGLPRHLVNKGFSPLYGSRTQFYGIMDYFYQSASINHFTPGLQNAFVGVLGNPTSRFSYSATYHYLATATQLQDLHRTLGHTIELSATYHFTKDISLEVGYTQMIGTDTMDRLKQGDGSKHARWGWFSLLISPSIFTAKW